MNDLFDKKFIIRNTKGQTQAFEADIKKAKIDIENIVTQHNCKDLLACRWNYAPSNFNELKNMILNSQDYQLNYNYENHTVEIYIKLNVIEEKNKVILFFELNNINIIIKPSYTKEEEVFFTNYIKNLKLKKVTCDNKHIIKLFYRPVVFSQEYQEKLKTKFIKFYNLSELNKINIVIYDGMFVNLLNTYNSNTIYTSINNDHITIRTQVKSNNKPNCPNRTVEHCIENDSLRQLTIDLQKYIIDKNLENL